MLLTYLPLDHPSTLTLSLENLDVFTYSTDQRRVDTSQGLSSHTWLVATILQGSQEHCLPLPMRA